jgi:hypothetical protein
VRLTIRDATEADAEAVAALLGDLGYPTAPEAAAAFYARQGFETRSRAFTKRL